MKPFCAGEYLGFVGGGRVERSGHGWSSMTRDIKRMVAGVERDEGGEEKT